MKQKTTSDAAPTVSVIMNCLNCGRYLKEAISSVYAQTYTDWEIVFYDNASDDDSMKIASAFDHRVRCYSRASTIPLGAARNEAIKLARGEFIAFLDCDDLWLPEKLERQIPLFDDPDVGLVFCDTIFFNNRGDTQRFYENISPHTGYCFDRLISSYALSMESVVIRRSALGAPEDWFDTRFNMIEEADMFRRIGYRWKLAMVDRPLAKWRVHGDSWTWQKGYLLFEETNMMLDRFANMIPDFEERYRSDIAVLRRSTARDAAFYLWRQGQGAACRRLLRPHRWSHHRVLLLYVLSVFPASWVIPLQRLFRRRIVTP